MILLVFYEIKEIFTKSFVYANFNLLFRWKRNFEINFGGEMNRVALWGRPVINTRANRYKVGTQRVREKKGKESSLWLTFATAVILSLMICLTVNLRASNELSEESKKYQLLSEQANRLLEENKRLREEVKKLKTDPATIEREARKLGMSLPNEKVLVSAN
ncbi:MAG: hypothetical protein D6687_10845 [Acidobacteria bacterium]|nr:MAG: hypothetical protein D6687_10845 [Acidobacteriota bacterium]